MKKEKMPVTELSRNDRRILDKYTRFYTNFIESNTAKNNVLKDEGYTNKD